MIYFISDGSAIKIGRSEDVASRMKAIATGCARDLSLVATVEGASRHESKVHSELSRYRINREWFVDCDEVRSAIKRYQASGINVEALPAPTTSAEIVKKCRAAGLLLISRMERDGHPKMQAYEMLAASVGARAQWLRKFLCGYPCSKEPGLAIGYSLLIQAGSIKPADIDS